MKVFFAICFACVLVSCSAATGDRKHEGEERAKSCREKVGATAEDLAQVNDHTKVPESEGAKKILVCSMKEGKLIVDGKFSAAGAIEAMRGYAEGKPDAPKMIEDGIKQAEMCEKEINDNLPAVEEDLALKIRECLVKNAKHH